MAVAARGSETDDVVKEEDEDIGEDDKKQLKAKPAKGTKKAGKPGANMDLIRETGASGYMNDYFAGASKLKSD